MKNFAALGIEFDSSALLQELNNIVSDQDWLMHFNTSYFDGEWKGINLIGALVKRQSLAPDKTNQQALPFFDLNRIPNTNSLLQQFKCKIISARYLKLQPGSIIKTHTDPDIGYWHNLVRIHLPICTNESTEFTVDGENLHMSTNKAWYADFGKPHSVVNEGDTDRIHLVLDLEVNAWLRNLFIDQGILHKDETKPDLIDLMSTNEREAMILSLLAHKTDTSKTMAMEMIEKYGLTKKIDIHDF